LSIQFKGGTELLQCAENSYTNDRTATRKYSLNLIEKHACNPLRLSTNPY